MKRLLKNGVTIIDNRSTEKLENVEHLGDARSEVFKGDVARLIYQKFTTVIICVFHLAALPSVQRSIDDPLTSYESNSTGTLRVLIVRANRVVYGYKPEAR